MRKIFSVFLTAATAWGFAACSNRSGNDAGDVNGGDTLVVAEAPADLTEPTEPAEPTPLVTRNGVGPVVLGLPADSVPASLEGVYDKVRKIHVPAEYNEMEDYEIPAYDYLLFKSNGTEVMRASIEKKKIAGIDVVSPALDYEGLRPGMSVSEAIKLGAKCFVMGSPEGDAGQWAEFRYKGIAADFCEPYRLPWSYFSQQGFQKWSGSGWLDSYTDLGFTAADFKSDAVVTKITIHR